MGMNLQRNLLTFTKPNIYKMLRGIHFKSLKLKENLFLHLWMLRRTVKTSLNTNKQTKMTTLISVIIMY